MKNKKNITFLAVVAVLIVMLIGATSIHGNSKTSKELQAASNAIQPDSTIM